MKVRKFNNRKSTRGRNRIQETKNHRVIEKHPVTGVVTKDVFRKARTIKHQN